MLKLITVVMVSLTVLLSVGCSREVFGGAVLGAGAAGAAYEYSNKNALENLKHDYEQGKISRDEYLRRKQDVEDKSLLY